MVEVLVRVALIVGSGEAWMQKQTAQNAQSFGGREAKVGIDGNDLDDSLTKPKTTERVSRALEAGKERASAHSSTVVTVWACAARAQSERTAATTENGLISKDDG